MAILEAPEIQLKDVLSFNERLVALAKAGIPIALEPDPSDIEGSAQRISATFGIRAGHGESIESILATEPSLSPEYRDALRAWVLLDKSMVAAQPLVNTGRWRQSSETGFGYSLCSAWIVWMLASLALLMMIWNLTPKLRGFYDVAHLAPGPGLLWLEWVYAQWALWCLAVAVLAIGLPLLGLWGMRRSWFAWLPLRSKLFAQWRRSEEARVASLAVSGAHAMLIGDSSQPPSPMLAWALQQSRESTGSKDASEPFQLVANLYRSGNEQGIQRIQAWIPTAIGLAIGGLVVLALGLALFWPMFELIIALCEPPRVYHE
jgi:hypothetical protein